MPRHTSEEKLREYGELKRFFEVWATQLFPNQFFGSDQVHHPVNVLAAIEQKFGRARALSSLKQAIGDCLEGIEDLGPKQIAQLDALLRQADSPTLTQMLGRQSKAFKAILRRGKISNDTEFYLVSAALSDTSIDRPKEETATLDSMVTVYEAGKQVKP